MYQLAITKRRAIGIIASLCLLNLLTFAGGVALGVGLWMPTRTEIALASEQRAKAAPVTTAAAAPAKAAGAAAAPVQAPVQPAAATEELTDTRALAGKFALQVASFTDSKNAKQLETELKERGYPVHIFKAIDSEKRVWHVVRVGDYPDVSTASRAAAEFTSREQLQALVRRADAL